ncbi:leucine-rich repeat domain-containing protein [Spirosoma soli]|uniref:Leucine-rich repeat domain-containing protein n=1 Tax=Spirosoma soli TaxID=1770529 RepID=A0ABW5M094_9BACT
MTIEPASSVKPCPPIADTHAKRLKWWMELEPQWRAAFQFAFFGHSNQPSYEDLEALWQTPTLRFAGPTAPYANMSFELTNCSGLKGMSNLEALMIMHHKLSSISEVADMTHLKTLFVNNNAIESLEGIEKLKKLEQLFVQVNNIISLEPIRDLTNLRQLYVSLNPLKSLNGLTQKHTKALKAFFCLPNDNLTDREIMRVERTVGIRCRSL